MHALDISNSYPLLAVSVRSVLILLGSGGDGAVLLRAVDKECIVCDDICHVISLCCNQQPSVQVENAQVPTYS